MHRDTETVVLNNGYTTKSISVQRGVPQGCPLSPFMFIILDRKIILEDCK